jgi:SpoVK/Ycf46/Vps4 family AAA+-type ATPase
LVEQRLTSNVTLSEVEPVDFQDPKGIDDVLRALEMHIILPFKRDELAQALDLRPKKGDCFTAPRGRGRRASDVPWRIA